MKRGFTLLIVFAISIFLLPSAANAAPRKLASKECIECHKPVLSEESKRVVHAPFKDEKNCEACHKRHGVVGTLVLIQEQPGLCFSCHKKEEAAFKAAHVHVPVSQGTCTKCHSAHSSDFPALLRANGNQLCFTCHDKKKFTQASVHKPAGENCLTCHDAHAGANERRLTKPVAELCTSCHVKGGKGPVPLHNGYTVGTNCTNCHSPHSAPDKHLLRAV
ncbi:MAG: cytochrome c3 family protein, partial [Thermoanaerobaculia bacterium]